MFTALHSTVLRINIRLKIKTIKLKFNNNNLMLTDKVCFVNTKWLLKAWIQSD